MSNHLSVAAVTATLVHLLSQAVSSEFGQANVSASRPDTKPPEGGTGIYIFLYAITPNAQHRNIDVPTYSSRGVPRALPRQAADLQYLLSFYGNEEKLEPHRLYGLAMQRLLATPFLTSGMISASVESWTEDSLKKSNLASNMEDEARSEGALNLTIVSLSLEELSKLWSVFFQTQYRLSVAYQVSPLVLDAAVEPPQPVAEAVDVKIGVMTQVPPVKNDPLPAKRSKVPSKPSPTGETGEAKDEPASSVKETYGATVSLVEGKVAAAAEEPARAAKEPDAAPGSSVELKATTTTDQSASTESEPNAASVPLIEGEAAAVRDEPLSMESEPSATLATSIEGGTTQLDASLSPPAGGEDAPPPLPETAPAIVVPPRSPVEDLPVRLRAPALWLRADHGLQLDFAENISRWVDASDGSRFVEQVAIELRPIMGKKSPSEPAPVLFGERANTHFVVSNGLQLSLGTIFMVARNGNKTFTTSQGLFSGPNADHIYLTGSKGIQKLLVSGRGQRYVNGKLYDVTNGITSIDQFNIYACVDPKPLKLAGCYIGKDRTFSDRSWTGEIAEVLIYEDPLAEEDRRSVEQYLKQRYGIA